MPAARARAVFSHVRAPLSPMRLRPCRLRHGASPAPRGGTDLRASSRALPRPVNARPTGVRGPVTEGAPASGTYDPGPVRERPVGSPAGVSGGERTAREHVTPATVRPGAGTVVRAADTPGPLGVGHPLGSCATAAPALPHRPVKGVATGAARDREGAGMKKAVYQKRAAAAAGRAGRAAGVGARRGRARSWSCSRAGTRRARAAPSSASRSTSTPASPGSRRCPAPTERERTQWYFQRYVEHLPAAGEIVLFDRSWYNRAGVERVMGFCTPEQHRRFLHQCPIFERLLVEDGMLLRKYWFSVSDDGAGAPVPPAAEGPDAAVEALPDGPGVD